jgi:hypothetical protein
MAQTQRQTQTQTQTQEKKQLIRLSKSRKSYVYQGRYYKLTDKQYYRFDTQEDFNKRCDGLNQIQKDIQLKIISVYNDEEYDEDMRDYHIMDLNNTAITQRVHRIFTFNRNLSIIFKHNGMQYSLVVGEKPFIQFIMAEAKELLHILILSKSENKYHIDKQTQNQGIRETMLFIELIKQHFAFKREKMIALLPRFLGYRVDANIATIIYDYCF